MTMTMFLNIVLDLPYIKRQCHWLNNVRVVGYWAYIRGTYIWGAYIRGGGLYLE
jgi:hypothetical protein